MSTPPRTTSVLVQGVLLDDYDTLGAPDLTPFISWASAIVDRAVTMAANRGYALTTGTNGEQELMERFLAAHAYAQTDQTYQSKNSGASSASFRGQTTSSFDGTLYGQRAVNMDISGSLNAIGRRLFARGVWLGTDECGGTGVPSSITSRPWVGW